MPAWEEMLTEEEIWQVILFMYEATDQVPRTWE
jgi:mono/diheme cytochrome c family protein